MEEEIKCTYYGKDLNTLSREELVVAVETLAVLLEETRQNLLTALEIVWR